MTLSGHPGEQVQSSIAQAEAALWSAALQVVTYLRDPKGTQFRGLARPPKGILLEGDPGVGKTLIAKAIAGEAGVPFFQVCSLIVWPLKGPCMQVWLADRATAYCCGGLTARLSKHPFTE